jgi:hypothetical protein
MVVLTPGEEDREARTEKEEDEEGTSEKIRMPSLYLLRVHLA